MAYYTALTTAWNGGTQPPTGVTGTGLLGGDTTVQKLAKVNAWTVTGSIPTSFYTTGAAVLNCIDFAEFNALTAARQTNVLMLCAIPGQLLGGSAQTAKMVAGMIIAYFPGGGATITALTALSQATTQTWCKVNGYPEAQNGGGGLTLNDTTAAGLV